MGHFDSASDAIWPGYTRREAKRIQLVLIDDHRVVREGISALLSLESKGYVLRNEAGQFEVTR